jgi:hypothetical protein
MEAPLPLNVPSEQSKQVELRLEAVNDPAGHGRQALESLDPLMGLYVPAVQSEHAAP